MGEDQRRFPRIASHHSVLVKELEPQAVEEFARAVTIARGGCCFFAAESLGVGALLDLLIAVDHETVRARARVVYERPHESGQNEVGVEFLNLDDASAAKIDSLFSRPDRGASS